MLEKKGDNDGALKLFSQSQAISEELCTKEPENLAHRRDLGIALENVGRVLEKKSRYDQALTLFRKNLEILRGLRSKQPENLVFQRSVGVTLNWIGSILAKQKNWQESLAALKESFSTTEATINAGGTDFQLGNDLSNTRSWIDFVEKEMTDGDR